MNDTEREDWVRNDEGLYAWWQSERPRQSLRTFVRANRAKIDEVIEKVTSGEKRHSYLKYGD
jgi:hypothetical protein